MTYNNLKMTVAVNNNYMIGSEGRMIWSLPSELKHFRELTMNSTLIIGKNTYESMRHLFPLEGREIFVISSSMEEGEYDLYTVFPTVAKVIEVVEANPEKTYFVAGGAMVYRMMTNLCKELHISLVDNDDKGDTCIKSVFDKIKRVDYDFSEPVQRVGFTYCKYTKK